MGEGDTIKTGEKSVAIIQFENDSASVEIQENAEFSINKFNEKEQELASTKGNFWIKAKKAKQRSNFNVVMPTSRSRYPPELVSTPSKLRKRNTRYFATVREPLTFRTKSQATMEVITQTTLY
ncbi:MAG: FecR domain-containing protein [Saprospirales bacterium]|nr:FecR domain-containing protein [Saprospirales bacterium]